MERSKAPHRPKLVLSIYVTRSKETLQPPFYSGRPNVKNIVTTMVETHPDKVGLVFACGPTPLVSELWDSSIRSTMKGRRVDFHHEVFDF